MNNNSSFTTFLAENMHPKEGTIVKALKEYKKNITFSELSVEFLSDFERFLYASQTVSIDDVHNYFATLAKYSTKAVDSGLLDSTTNPFTQFKPKSTTQRIVEDLERVKW